MAKKATMKTIFLLFSFLISLKFIEVWVIEIVAVEEED